MKDILKNLNISPNHQGTSTGLDWFGLDGQQPITSFSPVNGDIIGAVNSTTKEDYVRVIDSAVGAFNVWRIMPAPKRI